MIACCDQENQASVRVLERLGFSRTKSTSGQLRWRL